VALAEPRVLAWIDPSTKQVGGELPKDYEFKGVDESDGGSQVTLAHPVGEHDFRVVAMGTDGKKLSPRPPSSSLTRGKTTDETFNFGAPLGKITHFRIEVRDYEWVELDNLALEPTK
jgi:hypothetical protein